MICRPCYEQPHELKDCLHPASCGCQHNFDYQTPTYLLERR